MISQSALWLDWQRKVHLYWLIWVTSCHVVSLTHLHGKKWHVATMWQWGARKRKAMLMTEMSLVIWKQPASLYLHILNCQCDKIILSPSHSHDTDISLWNKRYRIQLNYLGKWGCERQKAQVIQNMNNIRWLNYLKTVSCHLLLAVFYYITAAHSAEWLHVWWSSSEKWPATVVR